MNGLKVTIKTIQLSLPKIGIGWMFALLTSNFNRIAIHDLGVVAVVVTTMIGLYHFLSPFQVVFGRMADRYPVFGFRRSPYLLGGLLVSSLVFLALPSVAVGMGQGSILAVIAGFVLLILFGVGFAAAGSSHLALIADVTTTRSRGIVVAIVWTMQIASVIAAAIVMKIMMGDTYSFDSMQRMYSMTPLIVLSTTILALIGMERRVTAAEAKTITAQATEATPDTNIFTAPIELLRSNPITRLFFAFIMLSTLGVFLQDTILEVFGADVLGMNLKQTTSFQQTWGGGVLLSMIIVGIIIAIRPFSRHLLARIGGFGTAAGLLLLTFTAITKQPALMTPTLLVMGVFTGLYTLGSLSLMMELQAEGATATYMGLWGMAQALGNGLCAILAGTLHTALIGSHLLPPAIGFAAIFALEAVLMAAGAVVLGQVSLASFRKALRGQDVVRAMELEAA